MNLRKWSGLYSGSGKVTFKQNCRNVWTWSANIVENLQVKR